MTDKRTWTDGEIGEQRQLLSRAAPNALYYERGRLDCMLGAVVPPTCSTTERIQWDSGWADEYRGVERPYVPA